MDVSTADATVDFILATNCPDRDVRVTFYGGEALLALQIVKHITSRLYDALKERVEFAVSTNGLLLTDGIVDWICSYPRFKAYVSLDSYAELHDRNRLTAGGSKTFSRIIANLERFDVRHHERYINSVFYLVTLTSWKELPEASRRWGDTEVLRHSPPMHLSFVIPRNPADVNEMIASMEERRRVLDTALAQYEAGMGNLLTSKFKEWTDIVNSDSQSAETEGTITVTTCVEDFYRTFISSEGDIYICERFAGHFTIGTVYDGIRSDALEEIEKSFIDLRNKQCAKCEVAGICSKCMTLLNHADDHEMLDALCGLERRSIRLIEEYAWKRRQVDRRRELSRRVR